ncbi:MAG TPA: hypothetical protein VFO38_04650 [Candidatus Saccharimonadales bacterium]|nr:hypothetical protein [Candidatus Saccharimonadales bacterium]
MACVFTLASLGLVVPSALAAPSPDTADAAKAPVSTVTQKVEPGKDAVADKQRGKTAAVKTDVTGKRVDGGVTAQAGYVATVDFVSPGQYCQQGLVQTGVKNNTSTTRYYYVYFYNYATGAYTVFYGYVNAYSYAFPSFRGNNSNTWSATLYTYNPSTGVYDYDEWQSRNYSCNVSMTFYKYPGYTGYVLLQYKNSGTAYASVLSHELAPNGASGTYTGMHWDYPAPSGGVANRYLYVGSGQKYGIYGDLYGAQYYLPWYQWGTL